MDILQALEKIRNGENAAEIAEEFGIDFSELDLNEMATAAEYISQGATKWKARGPVGQSKTDEKARRILKFYGAAVPKFLADKDIVNGTGIGRGDVQRLKNMLIGAGFIGYGHLKGKKRNLYILTRKGLEFLRVHNMISNDKYNRARAGNYEKAMNVARSNAMKHQPKLSTKQKEQANIQAQLADIASDSKEARKMGTDIGALGFHHKKGSGGVDTYSITIDGRKIGATWRRQRQLFIGNRKLPPTRVLSKINLQPVRDAISRAGYMLMDDVRVVGYKAGIEDTRDIVVAFKARKKTPEGIQAALLNKQTAVPQ